MYLSVNSISMYIVHFGNYTYSSGGLHAGELILTNLTTKSGVNNK